MATFWKVRVETPGRDESACLVGYYVVAVGETPDQALVALRNREMAIGEADLIVEGQMTPELAAEFKMRSGDIIGVWSL
jgi:hypothetical protein